MGSTTTRHKCCVETSLLFSCGLAFFVCLFSFLSLLLISSVHEKKGVSSSPVYITHDFTESFHKNLLRGPPWSYYSKAVHQNTCSSGCATCSQEPECEDSHICTFSDKSCPQVECLFPCVIGMTLRHKFGRGIGYDEGYTTLDEMLFLTYPKNNVYPFFDLRMSGFDDGEFAANLGLGFRYYSPCKKRMLGFNAFYDYRETTCHSRLTQAGIGFEILGECWDLRVNGYIPIRDKKLICKCFWTFPGDFWMEKKKFEEAMKGADFELGAPLGCIDTSGLYGCTKGCIEIYGAAGAYYFEGNCLKIVGGKARLKVEYNRFLSFEGIIIRDCKFKTRVQLQISLRFPLGGCCEQKKWDRILSQPIERNDMIVVDRFSKWKWNW